MLPPADSALLVLALAVLLDLCIGEYPRALHPVVWIGKLITGLLRLAPARGWWRQFTFGLLLALLTIGLSVGLAWVVLDLAAPIGWLAIVVAALLLKSCFALGELGRAADGVVRPLEADDVETARGALRSLCSRDPSCLGPAELLAGTIESVAENACDSVVAPLCYYLLLGVPGAVAYRAINTLDAMVGYRGPFESLGKVPARLDDLANWVPARLTAALLLLAGALTCRNVRQGWRIGRRDAANTPSPNGGRPMAVMAGLLDVRLDKPGVYVLGDPVEPLTPAKARQAWRLVVVASALMMLLVAATLTVRLVGEGSATYNRIKMKEPIANRG